MATNIVAETIYAQLGGRRFALMTGSKNFSSDGEALCMHLATNKSKAQFLRIDLMPTDLYKMTFSKLTKNSILIVAEYNDVYWDQLQEIFTQVTGLYTHL